MKRFTTESREFNARLQPLFEGKQFKTMLQNNLKKLLSLTKTLVSPKQLPLFYGTGCRGPGFKIAML